MNRRTARLLVALLALVAGAVVLWLASDLFAYHSVNDDEGVYLTQAAMLLDGRLFLRPGALGELVRPWFFVAEETATGGVRMYSKYAPVAPAVFALGVALDEPRLALALVAAGNVALVSALGAAAFDRRVGLLAGVALLGSPLFLFSSSVFLAYAPTTLCNLLFALAYVRANRRSSLRYGALAGVAIGVAFFSRPYTAVLFAAPFVVHTAISLWRTRGGPRFRPTVVRSLAVAVPGLALVGVALGYNALLTGQPFLFPYQAFGPQDGLGFGHHELLGYEETYTPSLALETTARVLVLLATDWIVAGPVGTALALVGVATFVRGSGRTKGPVDSVGPRDGSVDTDAQPVAPRPLSDRTLGALFLGVGLSVIVGNAYFWGTLNGLRNGLIGLLGPYYHLDALLPLSVFAAVGAVRVADRLRRTADRLDGRQGRALLVAALLVAAPVVAVAEASAVGDPYEANRLRTDSLAATYAPVEQQSFERAVVFLPDPYGDWLNHPFQYLRNAPDFGGRTLYVLDGGPAADFRALRATPNRRPYRFTYRGEWTGAVTPVESTLTPLEIHEGRRVEATTRLGVPRGATSASVRIATASARARYEAEVPPDRLTVRWTLDRDGIRPTNLARAAGPATVPVPRGESEIDLVVTFVGATGASVTYRREVTVSVADDGVAVIWPPETRICRLRTECGHDGTYVGSEGEYVTGVSVSSTARGHGAAGT